MFFWLVNVNSLTQLFSKWKQVLLDLYDNPNNLKKLILMEQVQNAPSNLLESKLILKFAPFLLIDILILPSTNSKSSSTSVNNPTHKLLKLRRAKPLIYCEFIGRSPRTPYSTSIRTLKNALGKSLHTKYIFLHFKVCIHLFQFELQITLFKLKCNFKKKIWGFFKHQQFCLQ